MFIWKMHAESLMVLNSAPRIGSCAFVKNHRMHLVLHTKDSFLLMMLSRIESWMLNRNNFKVTKT